MASYFNPVTDNPFFTDYAWVMTVRHVRVVGSEVVVEDANQLPRELVRIVAKRVRPQRVSPAPTIERNIPFNETQKGPYL